MNIESTTATTKTTESSTSSTSTVKKEDSASFKEQLNAVKTQDAKTAQATEAEATKTAEETKATQSAEAQKNATTQQAKADDVLKNNIAQQISKDKLSKDETAKNKDVTDPITELSSRIATLSELKSGISKTQGTKSKEVEGKSDFCTTIKMDDADAKFFLNLVSNQQMQAQAGQASNSNPADISFADIKTKATEQAVQVSSTLLDAMSESAKTGKSFRIDFDKDIAVIMKVDRNGTLSANFIPGDTAVENYLRNNIALLKQSFDDQGLAYNELTYSKHQKQEQQQQEKRKNNKENENE